MEERYSFKKVVESMKKTARVIQSTKYSQEIGISSDFFNISFLLKVMSGDLEHIFVFVSENYNFFLLGPKLIVH